MKLLTLGLVPLLLASCATRLPYKGVAWSENEDKSLSLSTKWIKVKKNSVDAMVVLENRYSQEIVIPENSLFCSLDGQASRRYKTNSKFILAPNRVVEDLLICDFNSVEHGKEVEITAQYLYAGQQAESVTTEENKKISAGKVSTKSVTQSALTFKEGQRLPSPKLKINIEQAK